MDEYGQMDAYEAMRAQGYQPVPHPGASEAEAPPAEPEPTPATNEAGLNRGLLWIGGLAVVGLGLAWWLSTRKDEGEASGDLAADLAATLELGDGDEGGDEADEDDAAAMAAELKSKARRARAALARGDCSRALDDVLGVAGSDEEGGLAEQFKKRCLSGAAPAPKPRKKKKAKPAPEAAPAEGGETAAVEE